MYVPMINERSGKMEDSPCLKGGMYAFGTFTLSNKLPTESYCNCQVSRGKPLRKSAPSIIPNVLCWALFPRLPGCCFYCGHMPVAPYDHTGAVRVYSSWELNSLGTIPSDGFCVVLFFGDVFTVLTNVKQGCFLTTCITNKLCSFYCWIFE